MDGHGILAGAIQRLLAEEAGPSALESSVTTFMEVQRDNAPGSGPFTPADLRAVCQASQDYGSTPTLEWSVLQDLLERRGVAAE